MVVKTPMRAIEDVLEQMWEDEERHYEESEPEGRKNHIFSRLKEIDAFLDECKKEGIGKNQEGWRGSTKQEQVRGCT